MYDCDKGYILGERGPPGATCVGGLWRPTELPLCLPGLHPRLRWNRRKRSLQIRAHRSQFLLRNIRQLQRKLVELLDDMYTVPRRSLARSKRNINYYHQSLPTFSGRDYYDWTSLIHRYKRYAPHHRRMDTNRKQFARQRRNRRYNDEAYQKYLQLLKHNHMEYINAMLRMSQKAHRESLEGVEYSITMAPLRSRPRTDTVKSKLFRNELPDRKDHNEGRTVDDDDDGNSHLFPIPFPNINDNLPQISKKLEINKFANNTYTDGRTWKFSRENMARNAQRQFDRPHPTSEVLTEHASDIIAQLNSQIVRKKRNTDDDSSEGVSEVEVRPGRRRKFNQTMYDTDDNTDNGRKGRSREPCEVRKMLLYIHSYRIFYSLLFCLQPIIVEPFMRIDIVREGKDPTNEFSAGTVIRATCAKEYKLNLQNPNGTAKCVRGRWKPQRPECVLIPCSVPSTERGIYVEVVVDPTSDSGKPSTKQLTAFDEVNNGGVIEFHCEDGYNVQGSGELKCWEGNWDVSNLPECVPAPCSLPPINNAIYQV